MILDGMFSPGSMLSQVKLAESLGVSRIPLREALRMLQREGLVEAEHNQRARVPSFEPSVVDSLDVTRNTSGHVGFGFGIHLCAGAPLARLEGQAILGAVARRVERFELGQGARKLNNTIRSLRSLPVTVLRSLRSLPVTVQATTTPS